MARTVNKTYEHQKAEVERNTGSKVRFSHDLGGKRSIAYVLIGDAVIVALALCSPRDNFCRATGRLVAVGRLYNYLYHAEPTKHVFKFKAVPYRSAHIGLYNLWSAVGMHPDVVQSADGQVSWVYLPETLFRNNNTDVDKDTTETYVAQPQQQEWKLTDAGGQGSVRVRWNGQTLKEEALRPSIYGPQVSGKLDCTSTQPEQEVRTFFGGSESSLRHYVENLNDQIAGLKAEIESLAQELQQETTNAKFWEGVANGRLYLLDAANLEAIKLIKDVEQAREEAESWESKARSQASVIEALTAENQKLTKELQEAREEADYWLRAYDDECRLRDSSRLVPREDALWR